MSDALKIETPIDQPVSYSANEKIVGPSPGMALCLSGGGYRAMMFHAGVLIRLNQLGILPQLKRISSVSGGSIIAALLGLKWKDLQFGANGEATNLVTQVIDPILMFGRVSIDAKAIIGGTLLPGAIGEKIAAKYAKHLYGDATLQDLPGDTQGPRFVINATNVQSSVLWRFSKPYMADYLVGRFKNPRITLAQAVAASSAFPPILSPVIVEVDKSTLIADPKCPLQREPYISRAVLSDGGVYDNLGLETAWKKFQTVLVSDAGAKIKPEEEPKEDWARHSYRILDIIDNQVRSLRKRQLIAAFENEDDAHNGAYWGIRTDIARYQLPDSLPIKHENSLPLASVPTRLKAMDETLQQRLVNWGYAVCDAAMRKHVVTAPQPAPKLPFPQSSV